MKIRVQQAAQFLRERDDILLLMHRNPDGDTLGCGFALCYALEAMGKRVRTECADELPQRFSYLYTDYRPRDFVPRTVVAVDVAVPELLGSKAVEWGSRIDLCIDHHPSNSLYAKQTCLCEHAAAACEIVHEILQLLGAQITPAVANCLYTGISTDCGCFKYGSTTSNTHRVAADLMDQGADYRWINEYLFDTKSKSRILVEQEVLRTMEFFYDDRVAVIAITQEMIERSHADESELDGVSSLPRMIEGVLIGLTIREKPDGGYRVSVRTSGGVDASQLCKLFGGGGHAAAAGCQLSGDYETAKRRIVEACAQFLPTK